MVNKDTSPDFSARSGPLTIFSLAVPTSSLEEAGVALLAGTITNNYQLKLYMQLMDPYKSYRDTILFEF